MRLLDVVDRNLVLLVQAGDLLEVMSTDRELTVGHLVFTQPPTVVVVTVVLLVPDRDTAEDTKISGKA